MAFWMESQVGDASCGPGAKAASAENRNNLSDRATPARPWGWNGFLRHMIARKMEPAIAKDS
jgi:hypothetical protein